MAATRSFFSGSKAKPLFSKSYTEICIQQPHIETRPSTTDASVPRHKSLITCSLVLMGTGCCQQIINVVEIVPTFKNVFATSCSHKQGCHTRTYGVQNLVKHSKVDKTGRNRQMLSQDSQVPAVAKILLGGARLRCTTTLQSTIPTTAP